MVGLAYPRWLERQGPLAGWRRVGWATQESGGGPQGEGPGSLKGQGLWHSEICNGQCHLGSPTPPTAAAALQWGSSRAANGLRLELSGPTKRPGSLAATGSWEHAHFSDKLRGGSRAIGAASGRARGLQTACRRDSAPLVLCPLSGGDSQVGTFQEKTYKARAESWSSATSVRSSSPG